MHAFVCDSCRQLVFFENSVCLGCGAPLGYVPERRAVLTLVAGPAPDEFTLLDDGTTRWRRCANHEMVGCNWMVASEEDELPRRCLSCHLTRTVPAEDDTTGRSWLVEAEAAKRRLVFELAELGLPVEPRDEAAGRGVTFDLESSTRSKVVTGHDDGVITLDLAEADDPHREELRQQLAEPYRTLLGHFRHEIGHYYWPVIVTRPDDLEACRALFGDERADYGEAIARHYDGGPPSGWQDDFVSAYATMHPFEDWAETFAHYLHVLDTLQTAGAFGMRVTLPGREEILPDPRILRAVDQGASTPRFSDIIDQWLPLTYVLNEINRSMGHDDLYPFVLAPTVMAKLELVDRLVRQAGAPPDDARVLTSV